MKNKKIIPLTIAMVAVVLICILGMSKLFENTWQQPEQADNSLKTELPDIEILSLISTQGNVKRFDDSADMADNNGVYSVQMLNDGCHTMVYSDFSSGIAEIMCTKKWCSHTDENCAANVSESAVLFTSNNRLYLVENMKTVFEISFTDYSRKVIAEFNQDYSYRGDRIFSNNEYFFTKMFCSKDNKYYIVAVNFKTGKITPLTEINLKQELVSAHEESIYLMEAAEHDGISVCNIIKYNVSTGKTEVMYTFDRNGTDYCVYEDTMFCMNKNEMLLKKITISTAEEQMIKDFSATDLNGDYAFRGANDRFVFIEFMPESRVIVVDTESGEFRENTFQRYNIRTDSQEKLVPMYVVDDKVVFCEGGKTITLTYDYVGKQQTTVPYYAFMLDTDYYNNIKNHTVMEY